MYNKLPLIIYLQVSILKALARSMNFKVDIRTVSDGLLWGDILDDGTATGLLGDVKVCIRSVCLAKWYLALVLKIEFEFFDSTESVTSPLLISLFSMKENCMWISWPLIQRIAFASWYLYRNRNQNGLIYSSHSILTSGLEFWLFWHQVAYTSAFMQVYLLMLDLADFEALLCCYWFSSAKVTTLSPVQGKELVKE